MLSTIGIENFFQWISIELFKVSILRKFFLIISYAVANDDKYRMGRIVIK